MFGECAIVGDCFCCARGSRALCQQNSICVLRDCVGEEGCPCSKGRCLGKTLRCAFVDETAVDGVCEEKPVEMVDSATVQRVATLAIAVVLGTLLAIN